MSASKNLQLAAPPAAATEASWAQRYSAVRSHSLALAEPLSSEDQCVQSMPDASPTKWHLAHTTWFFETLVLLPHWPGYTVFDPGFTQIFNSYYESLGPRHPRPQRGLLTRPSLARVLAYRAAIDLAMTQRASTLSPENWKAVAPLLELGLHHEQQHQELMMTDILHAMSMNPLRPAVLSGPPPLALLAMPGWIDGPCGEVAIGHPSDSSFAFDNEGPRHTVLLQPYAIGRRLVTNAEYQSFIDDGGYQSAALWFSDGWSLVQTQGWRAPLYWLEDGLEFGLHGVQPRWPDQPVRHLSYFEAAAFAHWAGARLPTEFEWEAAATGPTPLDQLRDCAWQWTRSSYDPYPRYRPPQGPVGEYNGKFMVGQMVLRGGSSATPAGHARATYRNFFPPATRWQFAGLRLARDL